MSVKDSMVVNGNTDAKAREILNGMTDVAKESSVQAVLGEVSGIDKKYIASDTTRFSLASKSIDKGNYVLFAMDTKHDGHIRVKADKVTYKNAFRETSKIYGWCIIPMATNIQQPVESLERMRSEVMRWTTGTSALLFDAPDNNGEVNVVHYGCACYGEGEVADFCVDIPVVTGGRIVILLVAYSIAVSYEVSVEGFSVCYDIE